MSTGGAATALVDGRRVAGATIFTAFVFATTFSFAVTTSTGGYFDVGEIMVYITALVMGPYVGAFAGGVGSALSDALLAPQFAPGTLVIKGLEGFIVGFLGRKGLGDASGRLQKSLGPVLGVVVAAVVLTVGLTSFPDASLSLGQLGFTPAAATPDVQLSFVVWILLAALAFTVTFLVSRKIGPRYTWVAFAIIVGGSEMVAGYFFYETAILRLGFAAPTAEIPVNALQAIAGLIVAPPVAARVRGAFGRGTSPGLGTVGKDLG